MSQRKNIRVLVPGAGTGRLAVEVASLGFTVEANELSFAMISASNGISKLAKDFVASNSPRVTSPVRLYPFVHNGLDSPSFEWRMRSATFDLGALASIWASLHQGSLSFEVGDFLQIYQARNAFFEVVVTCFFIDTGRSILQYLQTIQSVLRHGGIWVNVGPFHYHHKDALILAESEVIALAEAVGFSIESLSHITTHYLMDKGSMKPEIYSDIPLLVARNLAS